jgi:serine/threonine protein kinase
LLSVGQKLGSRRGPYLAGILLGSGSLADVYEGLNTVTGDVVAIKIPKVEVPFGAHHLRAEFRARIGVHHPNLVGVRELLDGPEGPWLVLERANGVALSECIDSKLSDTFIAKLAEDVVAGLRALHRMGRWHGDIKPANIVVGPSGASQLVDFDLSWSTVDDWNGAMAAGFGTLA